MRLALEDQLISQNTFVFDYGCGQGDDVRYLSGRGIQCTGWDPVYYPEGERAQADVVNLGYVVNVIERPDERAATLRKAWELARDVLIVSSRLTWEARTLEGRALADGLLTSKGTFQKLYEQAELSSWIETTLGTQAYAAAPGIFYVFRDPGLRQSFVASRFRRSAGAPKQRISDRMFEEHRALFEALMAFVAARGRLPDETELEAAADLRGRVGSLKRAFGVVRRVTGPERWDRIREERSQDFLVYLALARFDARPRFSELPRDLQRDVRAFFSRYSRACELADKLLFSAGEGKAIAGACGASPIGKRTQSSFYVHSSALPQLPPILRVYEGCARGLIGTVEGANVIKLHCDSPRVSYLCYPEFECDPHPALTGSLVVDLQRFRVHYRDYAESDNPPILHRKEEFVPLDHPLRSKFSRLTQQEQRWHLYDAPELIGTRQGWQCILEEQGVRLVGHRLCRKPSAASD